MPHSHHWFFDELAKRWADSNQEPGIIVQEKLAHDQQIKKGTSTSIIEERHANQQESINLDVVQSLLCSSVELKLPLIITVQNDGVNQSHDGILGEVRDHNNWLHLINEQFNCHLQLALMPKIFINHQESPYSIEMMNEEGFLLASIAVSPRATSADSQDWEDLLDKVKTREMSLLE